MSSVPKRSVKNNKSKRFSDMLFSFGCFIKQYTEWIDQSDNLLCEILKTQKYKEILKRSYTLSEYQVLLSVFRELSQKRKIDFHNKLNEYDNYRKKLQQEQYSSEKLAMKDLNHKLNQKKKLLCKQYGIIMAIKEYKKFRDISSSDIEKYYNERVLYWDEKIIDGMIEIRMIQIRKEMKECLSFYDYIFKKIAKLNTQKNNILFLDNQKKNFQLEAPEMPD